MSMFMSVPMLERSVLADVSVWRERFAEGQPFPHVVIDGFFCGRVARALLEQFPQPDDSLSPNQFGAPGLKAFRRDLPSLGDAYASVHKYFGSREFLRWASEVTGIDELLYDETNAGGGTHENFDGRDLRPHVDFNYHPTTLLHRRLNLIVYLNEEWEPAWGGAIGLHRDPRDPLDEVVEYAPLFNRCVLFETSERSWHGFEKITLPDDQRHRSRKSLAIYLYTRERPGSETYCSHTTFFVPRPLPPRFVAGYTLLESDANELGELIGQRDRLIELYQREQGGKASDM